MRLVGPLKLALGIVVVALMVGYLMQPRRRAEPTHAGGKANVRIN
jgi:hypothetical protein